MIQLEVLREKKSTSRSTNVIELEEVMEVDSSDALASGSRKRNGSNASKKQIKIV